MSYDYSLIRKQKNNGSKTKLIIIIFLILGGFFLLNSLLSHKPKDETASSGNTSPSKSGNQEELVSQIRTFVDNKPGSYSVYVKSLVNDESFGLNENMIFTAGSVNKIEILAALYHYAGLGEIDLDKSVTLQEKDIQDYGTGELRYQKAGSVYSLKTLARLMMEKSDNTAAYILGSQVIGLDKIQELINNWGLTQTDIVNNKTSNTDQEKMLAMIYKGEVAGKALTAEMLDFMDDSDFEDRLPAKLPKDVKIYHKIGTEVRNIHDVGIIDLPGKTYYLGVFVTDNPNDEDSTQTIADISQLVFAYFSGE